MRRISIMLVIVIGLMAFSSAPVLDSHPGRTAASIQALDICNRPASGDLNLPYFIQERPCSPIPPLRVVVRNLPATLFNPLLITFQDERPPRA